MLDFAPGEGPAGFLRTNLCSAPAGPARAAGLAVRYFGAVDDLARSICSLRDYPAAQALCWDAQRPGPGTGTVPDDARPRIEGWLAGTGLGRVLEVRSVRAEGRAGAAPSFTLVLAPRNPDWRAFGAGWEKLSAAYKKQKQISLEDRLLAASARALRTDPRRVTIHIDNYCHDFRIWGAEAETRVLSLRCTHRIALDITLPIDVSLLLRSTTGPIDRPCKRAAPVAVRDVMDFLRTHVQQQYGGELTPLEVSGDSHAGHGYVEFQIRNLYQRVLAPHTLWEQVEASFFSGFDNQDHPQAQVIRLRRVAGRYGPGPRNRQPPELEYDMEPAYGAQLEQFMAQLADRVYQHFCQ
jgi:hypothetical protein